jgi:glutamate/aspartate transport system substrate-binding protein
MFAFAMSGCGEREKPPVTKSEAPAAPGAAAEPAAPAADTLKKVKDTGVIRIGHRDVSIPFSYLDDKQQVIGYAVDLCMKVVDAVKKETGRQDVKVEFVPVTSQTRIPVLVGGNIDIECGSTTNSVERQKQVAFGPTYFMTGTKLLVKKSSGVKGYDDLKGKTVVYTQGTTNERAMKAYNDEKKLGINFIPAKDHGESFLAVETGRAAAFPMDDILLYSLIASSKNPGDFAVVGEFLSDDPYGPMLRKGDAAFKKLVDDTLGAVYKSDEMAKIYAKWFQSPIPPKNINLNVPTSDTLKGLFKDPSDQGVGACGKMKC